LEFCLRVRIVDQVWRWCMRLGKLDRDPFAKLEPSLALSPLKATWAGLRILCLGLLQGNHRKERQHSILSCLRVVRWNLLAVQRSSKTIRIILFPAGMFWSIQPGQRAGHTLSTQRGWISQMLNPLVLAVGACQQARFPFETSIRLGSNGDQTVLASSTVASVSEQITAIPCQPQRCLAMMQFSSRLNAFDRDLLRICTSLHTYIGQCPHPRTWPRVRLPMKHPMTSFWMHLIGMQQIPEVIVSHQSHSPRKKQRVGARTLILQFYQLWTSRAKPATRDKTDLVDMQRMKQGQLEIYAGSTSLEHVQLGDQPLVKNPRTAMLKRLRATVAWSALVH